MIIHMIENSGNIQRGFLVVKNKSDARKERFLVINDK